MFLWAVTDDAEESKLWEKEYFDDVCITSFIYLFSGRQTLMSASECQISRSWRDHLAIDSQQPRSWLPYFLLSHYHLPYGGCDNV
jgi:hypothetical protein